MNTLLAVFVVNTMLLHIINIMHIKIHKQSIISIPILLISLTIILLNFKKKKYNIIIAIFILLSLYLNYCWCV